MRLGILVCVISVPVILMMGYFMGSYLFSYLGFLVLLGALLILFMYVISLVSNELFFFHFNV